jgi:curved DNA-binding protein CbpA
MFLNYYDILGVTSSANAEEIKRAFRVKAKQFHPDVNRSADAPEKFRLVNEAYEVLIDTNSRYIFDLKLDSHTSKRQRTAPRPRAQHAYAYSAAKADPNFHYDWGSISRAAAKGKRKENPLVANSFMYHMLFFIGIFLGGMVIMVTVWGVVFERLPLYALVAAIPGIFMIREGWRGIKRQRTWMYNLLRKKKRSPRSY